MIRTILYRWNKDTWIQQGSHNESVVPSLILVFGDRETLLIGVVLKDLKKKFPNSLISGCSTSGEVFGVTVLEDQVVAAAIWFDKTNINMVSKEIVDAKDSKDIGFELAGKLANFNGKDLQHVLVFSDGLNVNGSKLAEGITANLPKDVAVTGGLAGDGSNFATTCVVCDDNALTKKIVLIGMYGKDLTIGFGSLGGWDTFGTERIITKSDGNVLYELDGKPALELYKNYLGEHSANLPSSGLLFPLSIKLNKDDMPKVRTILGIDENTGSITFAGDVPEGYKASLMKANFERLIDGAGLAAEKAVESFNKNTDVQFALLVSCVGRKLLLKQRTEEEIEIAREILGKNAATIGFYSYGEIAPFAKGYGCELHNQTMTITAFSERSD